MRKNIILLTVMFCACGCASFNSGNTLVKQEAFRAMRSDAAITPFAEIQLGWENQPYRPMTDEIAGGATIDEKGNFKEAQNKSVPVAPEDTAALLKRALRIFSDAGLYNKNTGRGTLRLRLASKNRWTYGELIKSYLVETSFIFILPSSLRVNYRLTAEFEEATGTAQVTTLGQNKTTFHLLLAPLYPFFSPGGSEASLFNRMLRSSAADIYSRIKRPGQAQQDTDKAALKPIQQEPAAPDEKTLEHTAESMDD